MRTARGRKPAAVFPGPAAHQEGRRKAGGRPEEGRRKAGGCTWTCSTSGRPEAHQEGRRKAGGRPEEGRRKAGGRPEDVPGPAAHQEGREAHQEGREAHQEGRRKAGRLDLDLQQAGKLDRKKIMEE